MKKFPFYRQLDQMDCGPTCLRMIAKHYGKNYSLDFLREKCYITRTGVSMAGISEAAEAIGMRTLAVQVPFQKLREAPLPCIAHWRQRHFLVVYKITRRYVYVADPGHGLVKYKIEDFLDGWHGNARDREKPGIVLLLEPTPEFYEKIDPTDGKPFGFSYIFNYLKPYKKFLFQLALGMLLGSVLELIFPFLTQALVDRGIEYQDIGFVYLILLAQTMLFFSEVAVQFIRSWILLHVSSRINISLISDFLSKLMRLPISFFDTRVMGDILQRIDDHDRIESFLTFSTLSVLFSMLNFVVFGVVLFVFNVQIFTIFAISTTLYFIWIMIFLKKRKELDFKRFDRLSDNQSKLVQLINGMQDIKLNNCEKQKRWEWERIQAKLFKVRVEGLALAQYQQIGASGISQFKDILITFFAAKAVIDGDMTLGTMLAVQYIVGQINGPLNQLIGFIQSAQDAKISFERLGEIRHKADEEPVDITRLAIMPNDRNLYLEDVSFKYGGATSPLVLQNVSMVAPAGKVTAIVGASGSGKTTLLKLLLKFYDPTEGKILLGNNPLTSYHSGWWRQQCGVVMQEGFIYSDTIARNIAVGDERINYPKLLHASQVANIQQFVESLPMGFNTKIGDEGVGISQGQRQRLLIARAVYKDPQYLFFDEATSALDANNEKVIMANLDRFFEGRTVLVVAHRLSTVKNADQIVVLHHGRIVEGGTHEELSQIQGYYYHLVKNQLELGG